MSITRILDNPDLTPEIKRRVEELYDKFREAFEEGVIPVGTSMFGVHQSDWTSPPGPSIRFIYRDDCMTYTRVFTLAEIEYIRDVSILTGDFLKNEIRHFNLLRSEALKATIEAMNKERRASHVW